MPIMVEPDFDRKHNTWPAGWRRAWGGDIAIGTQFVRELAIKDSNGLHTGYGFGHKIETLIAPAQTDAHLWVWGHTPIFVRETP